jgi:hypothetical protein
MECSVSVQGRCSIQCTLQASLAGSLGEGSSWKTVADSTLSHANPTSYSAPSSGRGEWITGSPRRSVERLYRVYWNRSRKKQPYRQCHPEPRVLLPMARVNVATRIIQMLICNEQTTEETASLDYLHVLTWLSHAFPRSVPLRIHTSYKHVQALIPKLNTSQSLHDMGFEGLQLIGKRPKPRPP